MSVDALWHKLSADGAKLREHRHAKLALAIEKELPTVKKTLAAAVQNATTEHLKSMTHKPRADRYSCVAITTLSCLCNLFSIGALHDSALKNIF